MSNEEKKEYLNRYRNSCEKIINFQDQLESLREVENSAKIQQLSDLPKGGRHQKDLSDLMVKIERLQDKIDDAIIESLKVKVEIEVSLFGVSEPNENRLLRLRYIEFDGWKDICCKMNYSWKQVHRIHSNALKNLKMTHNDTLKCVNI